MNDPNNLKDRVISASGTVWAMTEAQQIFYYQSSNETWIPSSILPSGVAISGNCLIYS